jgi:hypothetical protein
LIPELRGSVVGSQEIRCDLIIVGDVGGSVVQVLFNVIGGVDLIRRSGDERSSSSVERHSKTRVVCEGSVGVEWWECKRDDEGKRSRNPTA